MEILAKLLFQLPLLLFSITIHEFSHGLVAERRGDDTARLMGRLTLNPIAHIDLFGTIMLPLISIMFNLPVFGWAKPVPIDPRRLNNPLRDMMFIGFAGPLSNFLVAVVSSFLFWLLNAKGILGYTGYSQAAISMLYYLIVINVVLAVFNLIPVPPLDGSRIITGLLPRNLAYEYDKLSPYGFFVIIILMSTGILSGVLGPVVSFLIKWLSGINFNA